MAIKACLLWWDEGQIWAKLTRTFQFRSQMTRTDAVLVVVVVVETVLSVGAHERKQWELNSASVAMGNALKFTHHNLFLNRKQNHAARCQPTNRIVQSVLSGCHIRSEQPAGLKEESGVDTSVVYYFFFKHFKRYNITHVIDSSSHNDFRCAEVSRGLKRVGRCSCFSSNAWIRQTQCSRFKS